MGNICDICKYTLENPYLTTCSHQFCYICISRHLFEHQFCPTCSSRGISFAKLKAMEKFSNHLKPIKTFLFKLISTSALKKMCKSHKLNTTGTRETLVSRLKEFQILYNNECNKPKARQEDNIVSEIHEKENFNKKRVIPDVNSIKKAFKKLIKDKIRKK
ncbi:Postreplication repair E3 ubiquitin-protein ligase rad18 [Cucumispora dikerogammari]|nr:Postreplication repair E3 ubiquitin-protein ligase rad18 [Cucumispora dikerogammari]